MNKHSAVDAHADRRLLTTLQAADLLGVAPRTLEHWRQRGGGPPFIRLTPDGSRKVRAVRYRPAAVDDWIAKREVRSTSDTTGAA